jgi:hypothetical protein
MIDSSISPLSTEPPMVPSPPPSLTSIDTISSGIDCEDVSWNNTIDFLASTVNDPDNSARPW